MPHKYAATHCPDRAGQRDFRRLCTIVFLASFNYTLLLATLIAVAGKSSSTAAGMIVACFSGAAVGGQFCATFVLRRLTGRDAVILAMVIVTLSSTAYLVDSSLPSLLAATIFRGLGFGLVLVSSQTLATQMVPERTRGTGVGLIGLATGIPSVFAPTLGLDLFHRMGEQVPFTIAAMAAAVGVAAALSLNPRSPVARPTTPRTIRRAIASTGLQRSLIWFALLNVTRGAAITFAPLQLLTHGFRSAGVFLLVYGTCVNCARWATGITADCFGAEFLVMPSLAAGAIGFTLLACNRSAAFVLSAAALTGVCHGTAMTVSLVQALETTEPGRFSVPVAAWNVCIDLGFGIGAALFVTVAAEAGYGVALWALPALVVLLALMAARTPRNVVAGSPA